MLILRRLITTTITEQVLHSAIVLNSANAAAIAMDMSVARIKMISVKIVAMNIGAITKKTTAVIATAVLN